MQFCNFIKHIYQAGAKGINRFNMQVTPGAGIKKNGQG